MVSAVPDFGRLHKMDKLRVFFLLVPLLGILMCAAGVHAYSYDATSPALVDAADPALDTLQVGYKTFFSIGDLIMTLERNPFSLGGGSPGDWIMMLGRHTFSLSLGGGSRGGGSGTSLPTPLPSSIFLFGSGILGLLGLIRKVRYKFYV